MRTSCGVVERPDHHCRDDLVTLAGSLFQTEGLATAKACLQSYLRVHGRESIDAAENRTTRAATCFVVVIDVSLHETNFLGKISETITASDFKIYHKVALVVFTFHLETT